MPNIEQKQREQLDAALAIPFAVRYLAGWGWRLFVIFGVLYYLVRGLEYIPFLWIPVVIASLLAGLLFPIVDWLEGKRIPRKLGAAMVIIVVFFGIVGLLAFVIDGLVNQFPLVWAQLQTGWDTIASFIERLPINDAINLDTLFPQAQKFLLNNFNSLGGGVWRFGLSTTSFITYFILSLMACFFFMVEGKSFWSNLVTYTPRRHHDFLDNAAREGWKGVIAFARFQGVVAAIEGVYVWIVSMLLHVPLALPLGILVFVGAFIPVLGAVSTGVVAIVLAVATGGISNGLMMLLAVIVINQLESWILQPIIMGPATNMHAMVIIFTVVGGAFMGGILGALIGVPLVAFIFGVIRYVRSLPEDSLQEQKL